jgi:hypothetical protein
VPQRVVVRRPVIVYGRQRGRHSLGRGHARAPLRRDRDASNARPRPRPGSAPAGRPFTAARPAAGMAHDDDAGDRRQQARLGLLPRHLCGKPHRRGHRAVDRCAAAAACGARVLDYAWDRG